APRMAVRQTFDEVAGRQEFGSHRSSSRPTVAPSPDSFIPFLTATAPVARYGLTFLARQRCAPRTGTIFRFVTRRLSPRDWSEGWACQRHTAHSHVPSKPEGVSSLAISAHLDDVVRVEPHVLYLHGSAGIAAWVAHDAASSNRVVERAVHMTMNPQVRLRDEILEARRERAGEYVVSVSRRYGTHRRGHMGDCDG